MSAVPVALFGLAPQAQAEDNDKANNDLQIKDVVVTARKRDESLLKVPVAINALSAETIAQENITSLQDVARFTPSLQINDLASNQATRNNQQIIMRGMYTQSAQGVSVFIDGALVAGGFVSNIKDAARVEVLKGPQTAYFGRQTFAGAVNIVTKDPSDHFAGQVDGLLASDNWHDVSGSLEGPITSWLSGRLMVREMKKGGQYTNTVDGETLGTQSTKSVALNLKATPFEGFTAKFYGTYWQDRDGPAAVAKLTARDYNCNAGSAAAGTNNFICGTLPVLDDSRVGAVNALSTQFISNILDGKSAAVNPLFGNLIRTPGFARNALHAHLNLEYAPESWDGISVSSLTGMNAAHTMALSNLDNQDTRTIANPYATIIPGTVPYELWQTRVQSKTHDFSQEFRFASDQSDRFHWLFGVNYANVYSQSYIDGYFPYGAGTFGSGGHTESETESAFFALGYNLTSRLSVNVEGRYQQDKTSVFSRSPTVAATVIASATNKKFTPRVSVQYDLDHDVMLYASYAEGVNPPAFNTGLVGIDSRIIDAFKTIYGATIAVQPEYNKDYELGIKGLFFHRRLQLSAGTYYMNWTNQILTIFGVVPGVAGVNGGGPYSTNVAVNAGKTTLWGLEADGQLLIGRGLSVDFSAAYNPTKLKSYPRYVCPASACVSGNGYTDVTGNSLPYGPQFAGNVGVTYKGAIHDGVDYFVRVEDAYKGKRYLDVSNLTTIGSSNMVNLRGGLTWGKTSIEGFVENLFNNRQYAGYLGGTDIDSPANASGVYPAAFQVVMPSLRRAGIKIGQKF